MVWPRAIVGGGASAGGGGGAMSGIGAGAEGTEAAGSDAVAVASVYPCRSQTVPSPAIKRSGKILKLIVFLALDEVKVRVNVSPFL